VRALPVELAAQRGPYWMPIRGPNPTPIDTRRREPAACHRRPGRNVSRISIRSDTFRQNGKDSFKMSDQHQRRPRQSMISGASEGFILSVADMLDAIDRLPDDAEIVFGTCSHGEPLQFFRFKMRGEKTLSIEFS
jgi:hypothetical protein